jgi:hypothetical protein
MWDRGKVRHWNRQRAYSLAGSRAGMVALLQRPLQALQQQRITSEDGLDEAGASSASRRMRPRSHRRQQDLVRLRIALHIPSNRMAIGW